MGENLNLSSNAPLAARLIYGSDPAYYDFWFGSAPAAHICLEKLWQENLGGLSHAHCQTWQSNGKLAALASHYPAAEEARLLAEDAEVQARLHGDFSLLQQREAMLAWLFPHLPEDVWYLRTLAVSPEQRGQGLGSQALADIEHRARTHAASAIHVDVDSANPQALRFYQRHGFEIIAITQVPMLESYRLPASLRLAKKLY